MRLLKCIFELGWMDDAGFECGPRCRRPPYARGRRISLCLRELLLEIEQGTTRRPLDTDLYRAGYLFIRLLADATISITMPAS